MKKGRGGRGGKGGEGVTMSTAVRMKEESVAPDCVDGIARPSRDASAGFFFQGGCGGKEGG